MKSREYKKYREIELLIISIINKTSTFPLGKDREKIIKEAIDSPYWLRDTAEDIKRITDTIDKRYRLYKGYEV